MNEKIYPASHYKGLPPDLWPRRVWIGEGQAGMPGPPGLRSEPPPYIYSGIYLGRGFIGRSVTVLTTPTLILACDRSWPYLLLNPARSVGLTNSGSLYSGTTNASGNTQATPVGVANYLNMHFYLIVTACAGTYDFYFQVRDPNTSQWSDVQIIFGGVNAAANLYGFVGNLGVGIDVAVRWNQTVAGAITFSLGYTLKEGTVGSSGGLAQTIYIGPTQDVNIHSGYPILEGAQQVFIVGDNTDVWGIAEVSSPIRIWQL